MLRLPAWRGWAETCGGLVWSGLVYDQKYVLMWSGDVLVWSGLGWCGLGWCGLGWIGQGRARLSPVSTTATQPTVTSTCLRKTAGALETAVKAHVLIGWKTMGVLFGQVDFGKPEAHLTRTLRDKLSTVPLPHASLTNHNACFLWPFAPYRSSTSSRVASRRPSAPACNYHHRSTSRDSGSGGGGAYWRRPPPPQPPPPPPAPFCHCRRRLMRTKPTAAVAASVATAVMAVTVPVAVMAAVAMAGAGAGLPAVLMRAMVPPQAAPVHHHHLHATAASTTMAL